MSRNSDEEIYDHVEFPGWGFHEMPDLADDELDIYEYRLLGHYLRRRWAVSEDHPFAAVAAHCKMSLKATKKAHAGLLEKQYLYLGEDGDIYVDWLAIHKRRMSKINEGK